jgi:hypothetical protein
MTVASTSSPSVAISQCSAVEYGRKGSNISSTVRFKSIFYLIFNESSWFLFDKKDGIE